MKTTTRHEFKYMISYLDYFKIVEKIKVLLIHDKHKNDDSYPITSVYLDDLVHSGAMDKAFGNEVHKKYRVRHYHDSSIKKLEMKYKVGEISTKTSTTINNEIYQGIITSDFDKLSGFLDDELVRTYSLDLLKHHLKPTLTIEYQREAYKDETDNLRVTFDHSLCAERFQENQGNIDYQLMANDKLILEVKYEHFVPKAIKQLLKTIPLQNIAYSKYFMGFTQFEF